MKIRLVAAQYKLVTEGLNIRHVGLVLGFSKEDVAVPA
jgi:hypothetical protein